MNESSTSLVHLVTQVIIRFLRVKEECAFHVSHAERCAVGLSRPSCSAFVGVMQYLSLSISHLFKAIENTEPSDKNWLLL